MAELKLISAESVTEGHPDKVCDQISDAILDDMLAQDPHSHVAVETCATVGQFFVFGEVTSEGYSDIQNIVRSVVRNIGYTSSRVGLDADSCGVTVSLTEQSPEINQGVARLSGEEESKASREQRYEAQGAGDQGVMFGYACDETDVLMPLPIHLAHRLAYRLAEVRKSGEVPHLRPDGKTQVTIEYGEDNKPARIHTIVISTQHDEFVKATTPTPEAQLEADAQMVDQIRWDIINILLPRVKRQLPERVQALFDENLILHVNPTGKFVIGGPHGDTGLTGRKIIVDTYGGKGAHGGGAFSGKDPSKVDRSAAYAARHIAKNMVAAGIADEILIQISYAIGIARPVGVFVNTYGTAKVNLSDAAIAEKITSIFDLRPKAIEERLKLRNPIYQETASYGHMGRTPRIVKKVFTSNYWPTVEKEVELFTWEKLDYIEKIKEAFL